MSKFKVGDKVRIIGNAGPPEYHLKIGSIGEVLEVCGTLCNVRGIGLEDNVAIWYMGFENLELMPMTTLVTIQAEQPWNPRSEDPPPEAPKEKCYHLWQDVTLLVSTVTECSKCGILKDQQ